VPAATNYITLFDTAVSTLLAAIKETGAHK